MAVGCKSAVGWVDARVPVRASYVSLYKWPESDAEFVRSVAMARRQVDGGLGQLESPAAAAACYSMRRAVAGDTRPRVVDSYSCRQMYLRSYTFSRRKETVSERTMACFGRVREHASVFPFLPQRGGGSDVGSVDGGSASGAGHSTREEDGHGQHLTGSSNSTKQGRRKRIRKKKKKKGCAVVRRLQEASCSAVRASSTTCSRAPPASTSRSPGHLRPGELLTCVYDLLLHIPC